MEQKIPFFVTLPDRALIHASGPDAHAFLQNIITNDMDLLHAQPSLYACLLSPQGKFLFDFFISPRNGGYLIECEGGPRAETLLRKLTMYRLRSKVDLSLENNLPVFVAFNTPSPLKKAGIEGAVPDPRHPSLGFRTLTKPDELKEQSFETWDRLRLALGVPDGSRDMAVDKATMIESRIDIFNGVSFTKGCYIGQEITARMHNRGLAKKHLIPVKITGAAPDPGSDILTPDGHIAGEMRSSCGDIGLALIKDEYRDALIEAPVSPAID